MIVEEQNGNDPRALEAAANRLAAAANRSPIIDRAFVTFNTRNPALFADIDRTKAEMLGVKDSSVFDTLQTYLGSTFVNQFNLFGKTFNVYAQGPMPPLRGTQDRTPDRRPEDALGLGSHGALLGSVITLRHITEPGWVLRYNLYPAAGGAGRDAKPGHSTGEVMATMEKLAQENLPRGFGYEWTELASPAEAGRAILMRLCLRRLGPCSCS